MFEHFCWSGEPGLEVTICLPSAALGLTEAADHQGKESETRNKEDLHGQELLSECSGKGPFYKVKKLF